MNEGIMQIVVQPNFQPNYNSSNTSNSRSTASSHPVISFPRRLLSEGIRGRIKGPFIPEQARTYPVVPTHRFPVNVIEPLTPLEVYPEEHLNHFWVLPRDVARNVNRRNQHLRKLRKYVCSCQTSFYRFLTISLLLALIFSLVIYFALPIHKKERKAGENGKFIEQLNKMGNNPFEAASILCHHINPCSCLDSIENSTFHIRAKDERGGNISKSLLLDSLNLVNRFPVRVPIQIPEPEVDLKNLCVKWDNRTFIYFPYYNYYEEYMDDLKTDLENGVHLYEWDGITTNISVVRAAAYVAIEEFLFSRRSFMYYIVSPEVLLVAYGSPYMFTTVIWINIIPAKSVDPAELNLESNYILRIVKDV